MDKDPTGLRACGNTRLGFKNYTLPQKDENKPTLWKVFIDLFTLHKAQYRNGIRIQFNSQPVIANANSVVIATYFHIF
jgi:hypothetical protein